MLSGDNPSLFVIFVGESLRFFKECLCEENGEKSVAEKMPLSSACS